MKLQWLLSGLGEAVTSKLPQKTWNKLNKGQRPAWSLVISFWLNLIHDGTWWEAKYFGLCLEKIHVKQGRWKANGNIHLKLYDKQTVIETSGHSISHLVIQNCLPDETKINSTNSLIPSSLENIRPISLFAIQSKLRISIDLPLFSTLQPSKFSCSTTSMTFLIY